MIITPDSPVIQGKLIECDGYGDVVKIDTKKKQVTCFKRGSDGYFAIDRKEGLIKTVSHYPESFTLTADGEVIAKW